MTKRANGEGSVFARKDGRYEGRHSYRDPDTGRTKRVCVYGRTKTEVREKLDAVRKRLEANQAPVDSAIKVGQWATIWRTTVLAASTNKRAGTKHLYGSLSERHLEQGPFSERRLRDLRPIHVNQLMGGLSHYAPSSRRLVLQVLRQALDSAVANGYLAVNVAKDATVERPTGQQREPDFYEPDQVLAFLEAAEGERLAPLFVVMAYTGLRTGEALGLSWDAVDLEGGHLEVQANLTRVGRSISLGQPKSERSNRPIPLTEDCVNAFRAWRSQQNRERLAAGTAWSDSGLVFTNTIGKATEPRHVGRVFKRVAERAGLPGSPHTLRHSFVSMMLEAGVPIRVVSELVGHSSTSLTSDLYGHVAQRVSRDAVDKLGIVMDSARKRRA